MTRINKDSYGKGWHGQSKRHSFAAKKDSEKSLVQKISNKYHEAKEVKKEYVANKERYASYLRDRKKYAGEIFGVLEVLEAQENRFNTLMSEGDSLLLDYNRKRGRG